MNSISAYELYIATTSSTTKRDTATTERQDTTSTPRDPKKEMDLKEADGLCEKFKTTLSRPDVKVHFVGAW
jgi:hypothetical protein